MKKYTMEEIEDLFDKEGNLVVGIERLFGKTIENKERNIFCLDIRDEVYKYLQDNHEKYKSNSDAVKMYYAVLYGSVTHGSYPENILLCRGVGYNIDEREVEEDFSNAVYDVFNMTDEQLLSSYGLDKDEWTDLKEKMLELMTEIIRPSYYREMNYFKYIIVAVKNDERGNDKSFEIIEEFILDNKNSLLVIKL